MTNVQEVLLAPDTGALLYQWLGSFWTALCDDSGLVKQVQYGNGMLSAQLYERFTEIIKLSNRTQMPVYYLNKWFDVNLKSGQKNISKNILLKLNDDPMPVLGPQVAYPFTPGYMLKVGGMAAYKDITVYSTNKNCVINQMPVIVDNVSAPKVIYFQGLDFIVKEDDIFFLHGVDPFTNTALQKTYNEYTKEYEMTLWGCNVLIDQNYLYNYMGYIFGFLGTSSVEYKTALNSVWNMTTLGATESCVHAAVAAILGEPTVLETIETVVAILSETNYKQIITDKNVYTLSKQSELIPTIQLGTILHQGDLLSTAVKIFDNIDPDKTGYLTELQSNVPGLLLSPALFRAKIQRGLGISWETTDLKFAGLDINGNPTVTFDMYGSAEDVTIFWNDVFKYCADNNIPVTSCFANYIITPGTTQIGSSWGKISPFKFFCKNMLKANSFIIVVDTTKLSTFGKDHFKDIHQLYPILPAHIYMFVLEKLPINVDNYSLATVNDADFDYCIAKGIISEAKYGTTLKTLAYMDMGIQTVWIPVCNN